jgi:predicted glycosyltransferase
MQEKPVVWIDFENAPQVWVLSPIIRHLQEKGHRVHLTARDFSCTVEICQYLGYYVEILGSSGSGRTSITKAGRVLERALRLAIYMMGVRHEVRLALSHGSRSQIIAARLLGIPSVSLDDYEFSDQSLVRFVNHLLVPFPIPKEVWGRSASKVIHYPSLKEELYLCGFRPEDNPPDQLANTSEIKVLFRPEGRFAHYRSKRSAQLQNAILDHLADQSDVFLVLLPRDTVQAEVLVRFCRQHNIPYWLPDRVLNGPMLIWNVDVVIGGGGTMTREAAVLGVPTYSFFSGQWGAVDRHLEAQGRLVQIAEIVDIRKIVWAKRRERRLSVPDDGLRFVTHFIEDYFND